MQFKPNFVARSTPDYVHLPLRCTDLASCPDEHWVDGLRPDPTVPCHIEIDVRSGGIGYTLLTDTELAELAVAQAAAVAAGEIV